jgi:predicted PurR-regulated permease PerM
MSTPPLPRLPVSERMRRAGIVAWSTIGILILGYAFLWGLMRIRIIFPPLVLALIIIYMLNPLVNRLEDRGVSRTLATILSYVVVLGSITLLVVIVTPFISRQIDSFADDWPEFRLDLAESIENGADDLHDRFGIDLDTSQVTCLLGADEVQGQDAPTHAECDEVTRDFRERLSHQAGRITEIGSSVLEILFIFIVAPILALYLLIDLPQLRRDIMNLIPDDHKEEFADLGGKIGKTVGGFFRGQLLVALIVGIMSSLGFFLIDLRFWLIIGAIAGFTNLIPLVGPFIGGGLGFIVGSLSQGMGQGLKAALVALVVQQIDNHFISPNVMKRTVQLHPVTVMLSILAGGAVGGFWGVLLGVPTVAVAKLMLNHIWTTRVLGVEPSPYASAGGTTPPSVVPEPPERVAVGSGGDEIEEEPDEEPVSEEECRSAVALRSPSRTTRATDRRETARTARASPAIHQRVLSGRPPLLGGAGPASLGKTFFPTQALHDSDEPACRDLPDTSHRVRLSKRHRREAQLRPRSR